MMKKFRRISLYLLALCLTFCAACTAPEDPGNGPSEEPGEPAPSEVRVALVKDPNYSNGFRVKGQDNGKNETLGTFGYGDGPAKDYDWTICQWNSGYYYRRDGVWPAEFNLYLAERESRENGDFVWTDGAGAKTFKVNPESGRLTLGYNASREFPTTRSESGTFPAYLVEYDLRERPRLTELDKLYLEFNFTLDKSLCREEILTDYLAAQLPWYAIVRNNNPDSADYMKFMWFGAHLYDSRWHDQNQHTATYARMDEGPTDGFIYVPGSSKYLRRATAAGYEQKVYWDMLPDIRTALKTAQSRGYLPHTRFEDLIVESGNFGWEMPGAYDVSFTVTKFDLYAVYRQAE